MPVGEHVYLADTSAWIKSRRRGCPPAVRRRFDELLRGRRICTCDAVKLELLRAESSPARLRARRADLDALDSCPLGQPQLARALDVAAKLCERRSGDHRAVRMADYLIAAAAEAAGVALLHYDADYELIAGVTGQPHEWLAPRGEL